MANESMTNPAPQFGTAEYAGAAGALRFAILTAALVLCFFLGETIFLVVAVGATYRLFTKDLPAEGSRASALYYVAVLALLGLLLWQMPNPTA